MRGQLARIALDARGNPIAVEFDVVCPLGATGSFLDELAKLQLNPACEGHTTESASMPDANPDLQRLLPDGAFGPFQRLRDIGDRRPRLRVRLEFAHILFCSPS